MEDLYNKFWEKLESLEVKVPEFIQQTYLNTSRNQIIIDINENHEVDAKIFFKTNFNEYWEKSVLKIVPQQPQQYLGLTDSCDFTPISNGSQLLFFPFEEDEKIEETEETLNNKTKYAKDETARKHGTLGGFIQDVNGHVYAITARHVLKDDHKSASKDIMMSNAAFIDLHNTSSGNQKGKVSFLGKNFHGAIGKESSDGQQQQMLDFALIKVTDDIIDNGLINTIYKNIYGAEILMKVFTKSREDMFGLPVQKIGAITAQTSGMILPLNIDTLVFNGTKPNHVKRSQDMIYIKATSDGPFCLPGDSGSLVTSILDHDTMGYCYGMCVRVAPQYVHYKDSGLPDMYNNLIIAVKLDKCFEYATEKLGIKGLSFVNNMGLCSNDNGKLPEIPNGSTFKLLDMDEVYDQFCSDLSRLSENHPIDFVQSSYKIDKPQKIYLGVDKGAAEKAETYLKCHFEGLWKHEMLEVFVQEPFEPHMKDELVNYMAFTDPKEPKFYIQNGNRLIGMPFTENFNEKKLEWEIEEKPTLNSLLKAYNINVTSGSSGGFVKDAKDVKYVITVRHAVKGEIINLPVNTEGQQQETEVSDTDFETSDFDSDGDNEDLLMPELKRAKTEDVRNIEQEMEGNQGENITTPRISQDQEIEPPILERNPRDYYNPGTDNELLPVLTEIQDKLTTTSDVAAQYVPISRICHMGSEYYGHQGIITASGNHREVDFALVKLSDDIQKDQKLRLCQLNEQNEKVALNLFRKKTQEMFNTPVQKDGMRTGITHGIILPFTIDTWIKPEINKSFKVRCRDNFLVQAQLTDDPPSFSGPGDSGSTITTRMKNEKVADVLGLVVNGVKEIPYGGKTYRNVTVGMRLDHCFDFASDTWGIKDLSFINP